ncbi:MAG: hypothetical protein JWS12_843 [Candidatus Saccharibacteria bacterium]|nr:hypothetical protein [Candidatus Saccharibacteria bacterium]
MAKRELDGPDLEAIDLAALQMNPELETEPQSSRGDRFNEFVYRHRRKLGAGAVGLIAFAAAGRLYDGFTGVARPTLAKDKTEQPPIKLLAPPIAPAGTFDTKQATYICVDVKSHTVQPNDTFFAVTTGGLHRPELHHFMNRIFARNLVFLAEQAKTDPALANPNHIPIGHTFQYLADCIKVDAIYPPIVGSPDEGAYTRWVHFQTYIGTDEALHPGVSVKYLTNSAGEFKAVVDCLPKLKPKMPGPSCEDYVLGSPPETIIIPAP